MLTILRDMLRHDGRFRIAFVFLILITDLGVTFFRLPL